MTGDNAPKSEFAEFSNSGLEIKDLLDAVEVMWPPAWHIAPLSTRGQACCNSNAPRLPLHICLPPVQLRLHITPECVFWVKTSPSKTYSKLPAPFLSRNGFAKEKENEHIVAL